MALTEVETGVSAVDAVEGGDFEAVYREHATAVYRFCLSQLRDPVRAEEAAANALASACLSYARVRPQADTLRPWLYRIARNAVVDETRRAGRSRRLLERLHARPREHVDVENVVALRGELRAVVEATAGLSERDRVVVGLRTAGGLSHGEIGELLGISEGAAKVALHRALQRLRARLDGAGGER